MKKTFITILTVGLGAFLLIGQPIAQTATPYIINNTTLAAALNATSRTVSITSASAFSPPSQAVAAGQWGFVDLEAFLINSISGTTLQVQRGVGGKTGPHASGAKVFFGASNQFQSTDPPGGYGASCVVGSVIVVPWVNVNNGNVGLCRSSIWAATNVQPVTYNSVAVN